MPQVNLTKRVFLAKNGRKQQAFCPVVWSKNRLLKPHMVLVAGREEEHREGYYSLEWRENGRRIRMGVGNDPVVALNRLKRQEAILQGRSLGLTVAQPGHRDGVLLVNAITKYLDEIKQKKKKKTYVAYKKALDYFLESCHKQYLNEVTRDDAIKYSAFLREKKELAPRTVNVKFEYLMIFLKAQGMPKLVNKQDWPRYTEPIPEIYEKEDLEKFFAACSSEERVYYQFFLKTGMREQEVMFCTWSCLDLKHGTASVQANDRFHFQPKNYEERTIPIPDDLVELLREWEHTHRNRTCPLLFPTAGCKPKNDFLDICKAIALRARVNCGHCRATLNGEEVTCDKYRVCEHWFLHKFRATFCTWHLWAGEDLRTVQSYMGHKDIESTIRYLRPNKMSRAKVNAAFQ